MRGGSRCMIIVAVVPALVAGALLVRLREVRAVREPAVYRRRRSSSAASSCCSSSGSGRRPSSSTRSTRRSAARSASALCQMLALVPGVSRIGRDDRRRHADGARSAGGGGVLVLSRDADDGRRRSRTICSRCGTIAGVRARRWRSRSGSSWRSSPRCSSSGRFSSSSGGRASRRSPGIGSSLGLAILAALAVGLEIARGGDRLAVAAAQLSSPGFFVTVPLVISVAALVWIFGIIDGFTAPLYDAAAGTRRCRASAS